MLHKRTFYGQVGGAAVLLCDWRQDIRLPKIPTIGSELSFSGLDYFSAPTAHDVSMAPEMIVLPGEFPTHINRCKMN